MQPFGCTHIDKSQDNRHTAIHMLMHMLLQQSVSAVIIVGPSVELPLLALYLTKSGLAETGSLACKTQDLFHDSHPKYDDFIALAVNGAKLIWTCQSIC